MKIKKSKNKHGVRRRRPIIGAVIGVAALLLMAGGIYAILLCYAPTLPPIPFVTPQPPAVNYTEVKEDRNHIPKIGVNKEFMAGGEAVLDRHVWHRYPEHGDPKHGGNFILAAHRFQFAFWPGETVERSPFYKVDLLEPQDNVYIDYQGSRYRYEVTKRYMVQATDTYIEGPSPGDDKMTLYSCTLNGSEDERREVVEARLVEARMDIKKEFNQ